MLKTKLEIAKYELQIFKMQGLIKEKEYKILEREEDIHRIQLEIDEYKESINILEIKFKGENDE